MSTPTYDADQPRPTDTYSDSQPSFLDNFKSLYNTFLVNHLPLDATSGAGNHKIVQLIELGVGPQTGINDIAFYVKKVDNQTDQLFMRYPGDGTEVQLSGYQIYTLENNQYFTFIPGGGIIYFGEVLIGRIDQTLSLQPAICKNIVTCNFCLKGTIATQKPFVDPIKNQQGKINEIKINTAVGNTALTFFYIVWGQP